MAANRETGRIRAAFARLRRWTERTTSAARDARDREQARRRILAALHATEETARRIEARQRATARAIGAEAELDAARAALARELSRLAEAMLRPNEDGRPPFLH